MDEDFEISWAEFKKIVEDQGVKDETKISYIDIYGYRNPLVHHNKDGSCNITDGKSRNPD